MPPPYIDLLFFCSNTKCFEARKLQFSDISNLHMPIPKAKSWAFKPTTWVLTFTFTKLNLYLDLPPVIGFKHFIVLWKAYNKSNQIAQFLQRNFAHLLLKGICPFSIFLENTFRFYKFCKYFCTFEFAGSRVFPNV